MPASYIQKRLHWMGDSFKMYLPDTSAIQGKHVDALQASSAEVMKLISTPPEEVVLLANSMSVVTVKDENYVKDFNVKKSCIVCSNNLSIEYPQ